LPPPWRGGDEGRGPGAAPTLEIEARRRQRSEGRSERSRQCDQPRLGFVEARFRSVRELGKRRAHGDATAARAQAEKDFRAAYGYLRAAEPGKH